MNNTLDSKEEAARLWAFPYCDGFVCREDLIFCYPSAEFPQDPDEVSNRLQDAMDYLKEVTELNLKGTFRYRVIIGYRDITKQRKPSQPCWVRNLQEGLHWIYLPWKNKWKKKLMTPPDEPLHTCAHELVHPFYYVSRLYTKDKPWGGNEGWKDPFCEFLRGPVRNAMGLDGKGWWRDRIADAENPTKENWGKVAGEILIMAWRSYKYLGEEKIDFAERFVEEKEEIREFLLWLFENFRDRPLRDKLTFVDKLRKDYEGTGKI